MCAKIIWIQYFLYLSIIFRFPKHAEERKLWLFILGLETRNLPLRAEICSDHFDSGDFNIKPSGLRVLKKGAIPKPLQRQASSSSSR